MIKGYFKLILNDSLGGCLSMNIGKYIKEHGTLLKPKEEIAPKTNWWEFSCPFFFLQIKTKTKTRTSAYIISNWINENNNLAETSILHKSWASFHHVYCTKFVLHSYPYSEVPEHDCIYHYKKPTALKSAF